MLQFIRKFFQKEQLVVEIPIQKIPLQQLHNWIETHKSSTAKSIAETTLPLLEKIEDILFVTEENLTRLEHAELRNKKISSRELELMKGNKIAYILKTRQFLQLFSLEKKEKSQYKELLCLSETYEKEMQTYHDATLRQYVILQQFFRNESYAVAQNIKELAIVMKELTLLLQKQSTEAIEEIENRAADLLARQQYKEALEKEKDTAEQEEKKVHALAIELLEKRKKIEESSPYKEYLHLTEEKKEKEIEVEKKKQKIIQHFTGIEKALRKYVKKFPETEKNIFPYLENPLEALQKDQTFKILEILQKVLEELQQNRLEIKEDKKEKIEEEIKKTTSECLKQLLQDYTVSKDEKEFLEKRCTTHPAFAQYMDILYMLKTYEEKTIAYKKEKENKQEEIQSLAFEDQAKTVAEEIERCLKVPVEIILS